MTRKSDEMLNKRQTLAGLRAQLAELQEEYNRSTTPAGEQTQGRRARAAHQDILAEMSVVMSKIQQCEQDIGNA